MSELLSPLHVVSVSLGSSTRDFIRTTEMLGHKVTWERRGTDGNMKIAADLISKLDGTVDAIGLGGIDLYLIAAGKRFVIRDARKLAQAAKITPIVDGSGLKHTLERQTIQWLQEHGVIDFQGKKVLLTSGVDRFGMAEVLPEFGAITHYGDLVFAFGIPYIIKSLRALKIIAWTFLPIVCQLPFAMIYPTGEKQEHISHNSYQRYFDWADIIAGDFHLLRRYLPPTLAGKIIITNTTTQDDQELLRIRGAEMLITSTPSSEGRSPGTNVIEGVIVALTAKRPEEMTIDDYQQTLDKLNWEPNIVRFT